MRRVIAAALLSIPLFTGPVCAQDEGAVTPFESLAGDLKSLPAATSADTRRSEIADMLLSNVRDFALYALGRSVYEPLAERDRLDKQVGASSSSAGSTTLVSRGSVPSVLGVAVEAGALYQSVTGNVATFRLNPAGLARALATGSYLLSGPPRNASALEKAIGKVSASVSFDLQAGSSPGTFTGERSQLKEASARYEVINKRDPRHPSHTQTIARLANGMERLTSSVQTYAEKLRALPEYDRWRMDRAAALAAIDVADDRALADAIFATGDDFIRFLDSNPTLQLNANAIVEDITAYRTVRDAVFENIARSSILTLEYAFARLEAPEDASLDPALNGELPDVSTARVIFSSPLGRSAEAALNGSTTFFNSTRTGMDGHFRDAQVAGSVEVKLPEMHGIGRMVLTFAGLAAFLHQQPFGLKVKVGNVETSDGTIGVFQTKLTIPAGRTGAQVPLSFSIANRSEFNTEREVRGTAGLTFDLDALFSR